MDILNNQNNESNDKDQVFEKFPSFESLWNSKPSLTLYENESKKILVDIKELLGWILNALEEESENKALHEEAKRHKDKIRQALTSIPLYKNGITEHSENILSKLDSMCEFAVHTISFKAEYEPSNQEEIQATEKYIESIITFADQLIEMIEVNGLDKRKINSNLKSLIKAIKKKAKKAQK